MEPLSAFTFIASAANSIRYLIEASDQAKVNRKRCQALVAHAQDVLTLVESEAKRGTPPEVKKSLETLQK